MNDVLQQSAKDFLTRYLPDYELRPQLGFQALSKVWEVKSSQGRYFLKHYSQLRKFKQEYVAYQSYLTELSQQGLTARYIAHEQRHERSFLLLTALDGERVDRLSLNLDDQKRLYALAAEFLGALHEVAVKDKDMALGEALGMRLEHALTHFHQRNPQSQEISNFVQNTLKNFLNTLNKPKRCPCHGDFAPYNWLSQAPYETLAFIDFEHSKADLWLSDTARLWPYWQDHPQLEKSFWQTYQSKRNLSQNLAELRWLNLHWAVFDQFNTLIWDTAHQRPAQTQSLKRLNELSKLLKNKTPTRD
ncbi:MAG: aminoglycoside phosphotransferase family protein [Deinococcales bacterium]